jgi:hypothetical protein
VGGRGQARGDPPAPGRAGPCRCCGDGRRHPLGRAGPSLIVPQVGRCESSPRTTSRPLAVAQAVRAATRLAEAEPEGRQRVLDPGRHLGEDAPLDQAGPLQLTQGAGEHLAEMPPIRWRSQECRLGPSTRQPATSTAHLSAIRSRADRDGQRALYTSAAGRLVGLSRYVRHVASIPRTTWVAELPLGNLWCPWERNSP